MKLTNNHKYSIDEVESILNKMFRAKWCKFHYPGKEPVFGIVDYIIVDIKALPQKEFLISMGRKIYSVSNECLHECLKVLNGDIRTADRDNGAGPRQNN